MIIILSIIIIGLIVYKYVWPKKKYWENRGVEACHIKMFLSMKNVVHEISAAYSKMKGEGHRYVGLYLSWEKLLLIIDPQLIRCILANNFRDFNDRGVYYDEENDPMSAHLITLHGAKWKTLRSILSPAFTAKKAKQMFESICNCGDNLMKVLQVAATSTDNEIEIGNVLSRYTSDVIGSFAFGIDCNTLKNPNAEFREMGVRAGTFSVKVLVKTFFFRLFPRLAKKLRIAVYDSTVRHFFINTVQEALDYRAKNNLLRQDFLQSLQDGENVDGEKVKPLTIEQIAAQVMIFFVAGTETSAVTISYALVEIKRNANVERKLRHEVCSVLEKYNYKVTYEALSELLYLDAVIQETLRMYPPLPILRRKCKNPFNIPESNVVIEKSMVCVISILAIHRDPDYYADPDLFDPERFNAENKYKIKDQVYMPFGDGPRNCIGMRLAMIECKMSLALILLNFDYDICERTKYPLVLDAPGGILTPKDGIWLKLLPLKTSL